MLYQNKRFDFCVLIPYYNNLQGLLTSLQSIHYPKDKMLVLVVNDGSTQPITTKALTDYNLLIHVISYSANKGITHALNTGLVWITQHINTTYIARLDCGDTCHPQRFYKQVQYLNNQPHIGLLGAWCRFTEEGTGVTFYYTTPLQHKLIKKAMYFRNVFIHPAVMFRTSLLQQVGFYPTNFPFTEDYALFWKMLNTTKAGIIGEYLVTCVIDRKGISHSNRKKQFKARQKVVAYFGSSFFLKWAGILKLKLLLCIPSNTVISLKSRILKK